MRSSKEESSQNIIWFACYHKDEDSKEMKRTRLRDLKDSEENLVERKITQDASGNRSYVFFISNSHSHLFNELEIRTRFMYAYIYPLFLVTHSLIHKLTQAMMHTHVTLEPQ